MKPADLMGLRARTPDPLFALALPSSLALLLQNALTMCAMAMIGRLGPQALAAVGIASNLLSIFIALLYGLDSAIQVLAARYGGAGNQAAAYGVLRDATGVWLPAAIGLTVLSWVVGPTTLHWVAHDPEVAGLAVSYFRPASLSLLACGWSSAISAYWYGAGRPRYAFIVAAVQFPVGLVLTYLFAFGSVSLAPRGVGGAGIAVAGGAGIALALQLVLLFTRTPVPRYLSTWPRLGSAVWLLRIGIPIGIQQSLVYVAIGALFAIIARLGVSAVAVANIIITTGLPAVFISVGYGMAAATLVGSALGRHDTALGRQWGWIAMRRCALTVAPISMFILAFPRHVLGLFTTAPATVALGVLPLRLAAVAMTADATSRALGFAFRGAGATRMATAISFTMVWAIQLPLAWGTGVAAGFGLAGVCACQLVSATLEGLTFFLLWRSGAWLDSAARRLPPV